MRFSFTARSVPRFVKNTNSLKLAATVNSKAAVNSTSSSRNTVPAVKYRKFLIDEDFECQGLSYS